MEPLVQKTKFEKFRQHDGANFRKESRKFIFHYGTKVDMIYTKSTERIFAKILSFTYLASGYTLRDLCEILIHAFCKNLIFMKKWWKNACFLHLLIFLKMHELDFPDNLLNGSTSQGVYTSKVLANLIRQILRSRYVLSWCLRKRIFAISCETSHRHAAEIFQKLFFVP